MLVNLFDLSLLLLELILGLHCCNPRVLVLEVDSHLSARLLPCHRLPGSLELLLAIFPHMSLTLFSPPALTLHLLLPSALTLNALPLLLFFNSLLLRDSPLQVLFLLSAHLGSDDDHLVDLVLFAEATAQREGRLLYILACTWVDHSKRAVNAHTVFYDDALHRLVVVLSAEVCGAEAEELSD